MDEMHKAYKLICIEDEVFHAFREELNYEAIMSTLTDVTVSWKINTRGEYLHFPTKELIPNCKIWHKFIYLSLTLGSNLFEVTVERAILNYAIQKNISFNIRKITSTTYREQKRDTQLGSPFPRL